MSAFLFIAPYSVFIVVRISRTYARVDALSDELARRQATEEMLKLTQGRLAGMLNRLSMPLFAINESFEICFANHAFEELCGKEARELLGAFWLDLLGQACQKSIRLEMLCWFDAGNEGSLDAGTVHFTGCGGESVSFRTHVLPMDFDDERLALIVLADAGGLLEASAWVDPEPQAGEVSSGDGGHGVHGQADGR